MDDYSCHVRVSVYCLESPQVLRSPAADPHWANVLARPKTDEVAAQKAKKCRHRLYSSPAAHF